MWIILAILTFLAGQAYVVSLLYRLDRFLERQTNIPPEKELLTIAFADAAAADSIADLLERFSRYHPDIGIRLCSCQDVPEAVYGGKAAVGFVQAGRFEYPGLYYLPMTVQTAPVMLANCGLEVMPLDAESQQEMVWRKKGASPSTDLFVRYMRNCM